MKSVPRPTIAAFLLSLLVPFLAGSASAALDPDTVKCRASVAKSGAKLTKSVLKAIVGCHKQRDKDGALSGTDCNDLSASAVAATVADAEGKFSAAVEARCGEIDPAAALYEQCPGDCGGSVPEVDDFGDVARCLVCLARENVEALGSRVYGSPDSPIAAAVDAACHKAITAGSARLINSVARIVAKCQATAEKLGAEDTDACAGSGFFQLIDEEYEELYLRLELDACAGADLSGGHLDACDAASNASDLSSCVLETSRSYSQALIGGILALPALETATTTTSTTLPAGDPDCPGSMDIHTFSGTTRTSCSSNAECGGPQHCDVALGLCRTATSIDLGGVGYAHDADANEGPFLSLRLHCEGPGPVCGECNVLGLDAAADNCRCSSDPTRSCGGIDAESPSCPTCSGGPHHRASCSDDGDCSEGICTRRCAVDNRTPCSVDGDCPSGICPVANTRCGNGSSCDETSDCIGSCTDQAACECYVGTPVPVSAFGTPFCMVSVLQAAPAGSVDVDTGEMEISLSLRNRVYLGSATTQPCPSCGGHCSHDDEKLCTIDADCGSGHTCLLDTAGDGVRDGRCLGGVSQGGPCEVSATNSTFPARTNGEGGGSYSLDCMPFLGSNISGRGLSAVLTHTTDSSSLSSSLSCGGVLPGEQCPCLVCSGNEDQPCSSDAECALLPSSCEGADVECSSNDDCSAVNVGPCIAISSFHRCAEELSRTCTTNDDCSNVDAGDCLSSTCSSRGPAGLPPQPNACVDLVCSGVGGEEGECSSSPEQRFCDEILRADGTGILACSTNDDCVLDTIGIVGGGCTLTKAQSCFLDPIEATGTADPLYPVTVETHCMPPTASAGVNHVIGLPGPVRSVNQQATSFHCGGDPLSDYEPGVGGCP